MARLPTPGSDSGSWGDVLNDYLLQAHTTSGLLKSGSVGSAQIQTGVVGNSKLANEAVTTAKIADGTITEAKLGFDLPAGDGLRSLLVYYAPPSVINTRYNNDYAAGILSRYDDVVLGTGLQDPGNGDYANTTAIIDKVTALSPSTVIWGYIDAGVSTANHSLATLQTQIDQWVDIGAGGIFCDVIGYAYGVSRARQNSIIDYIHSKDVGAILNTFDPDEVFSPAVNVTYNPTGVATHADETDVLLLESWVFNSDAYGSPHYTTFSDVKARGDAARAYRESLGVRIFTVNIIEHDGRTEEELDDYRGIAEALARTWRLDGSGVSASTYASTGADVATVAPRFWQLRSAPLRSSAPYVLNVSWTQIEAPDLGIVIDYTAGTHTWTQL